MRQYHVGDVVVEEAAGNAFPIGILTDRDIVIEVIAENVPHDSVTVEDVMSGPKRGAKRGTLPLLYESTGNNLGSVPLFGKCPPFWEVSPFLGSVPLFPGKCPPFSLFLIARINYLKEQKRIDRQERDYKQATGGFRAGQGKSPFSP